MEKKLEEECEEDGQTMILLLTGFMPWRYPFHAHYMYNGPASFANTRESQVVS